MNNRLLSSGNRKLIGFFLYAVLFVSVLIPFVLVIVRKNALSYVPIVSKLDELVMIVMCLYVVVGIVKRMRIKKQFFYLILFLIYALFLLVNNDIPLRHILQIILDSRLFIYGLFFLYISMTNIRITEIFERFTVVIVMVSFLVSIVQVLIPDIYYDFTGIIHHDRGIGGVNLSSIFYSRVAFAQFLTIAIIQSLCLKDLNIKPLGLFDLKRNYILFLMVLMLLFTFSRKELLFLVVLMPLFYLLFYKGVNVKLLLVIIPLSATILFVLWSVVGEMTGEEFTETYVRFQMFGYATQIIFDYFPLGSGPGTFGSLFSLEYTDIYDKYLVSDRIVYGANEFFRGPIFDMFLISLTAEYGLGILIFIFFIFSIIHDKKESKIKWFYSSSLGLFLVYCSIVTPAFSNLTGLLVMGAIFAVRSAKPFRPELYVPKIKSIK